MEVADVCKVGVVGSGTMGFGIGINFALWGYPTLMHDLNDEILAQSMRNVKHAMQLFVEGELISPQQADEAMSRMTTTTDLAAVAANSDFITEAIVESCSTNWMVCARLIPYLPAIPRDWCSAISGPRSIDKTSW